MEPATQACRLPGLKYEVQCGKVQRALDPARPDGPKIEVHYAVVPAVARNKKPDPVFFLAGGPGQSAMSLAGTVMGVLDRLHARRDIVFVDQRGTGRSAPLKCPDRGPRPLAESFDEPAQTQELEACRAALLKQPHIREEADLGFFTTTLAMQDLDAVRQALGATQINLMGGSYGTRAALEYLRQFPQTTRRVLLDGVAPPDMVLPDSIATDSQAALQALWASCGGETACRAAFPRLEQDWAALKASLPRKITVAHPGTGEPQTFTLTHDALMGLMRGPLYAPMLASALPQAVSDAAQGRFEGLFGLGSVMGGNGPGAIAFGMHFSVICAEDGPRMNAQAAAAGSGDFGLEPQRRYERACAKWPRGAVPAEFYRIPAARQAVLLLSGGIDPVTPPRHAQRVAQALGAKAKSVVVPQAGHGVMSLPCMAEPIHRFFDAVDDTAALAVDAGCAQAMPRPLPFVAPRLDRAAKLRPVQEEK
jgi:pimeloyl-ACP methyl ester carboxylesterase